MALPPDMAEEWSAFGGQAATVDYGIDLAQGDDVVISSASRLLAVPLGLP